MARERPQKTLGDYVAIAISPALIMLLVGSLAYFLLEVTYDGQYAGRIRWVLFWFVFASVLVGRIGIEQGRQHASAYWVAVGLAGAAVAFRLLDTYRLGALVLLAVIMWCANKLTWDCTLIDDSQDASGEGLLQVSGFDEPGGQADATTPTPGASGSLDTPRVPLWKRLFLNPDEPDGRPHAPGLWVVYFSLAALPLFGVGQLFIPVENVESRAWGFRLLLVYVAAGMGLLLTTSFLGLRRYLRQRNLTMPLRMTASWLMTGTVMIAVLLAVCLLLPRPGSETSIADVIDRVASKARDASRVAFLKDGAGENEGTRTARPDGQQPDENQDAGGQAGRGGKQAGQSDDRDQPAERDGQSQSEGQERGAGQAQGRGGSSGGGQSRDSQAQASSEQRDQQTGQDEGQSQSGREQRQSGPQREPTDREQQARQQEEESQREQSERQQEESERHQERSGRGPGRQQQEQQGSAGGSQDRSERESNPSQSGTTAGSVPQAAEWVGRLVKFLLYLILAVVVLYLLVRHWRSIVEALARMWEELRNLFASLFGGRTAKSATATAAATDDPLAPAPPRPFRSFDNPFHTGAAGRMSPEELVIYTFRALEAWGYDQGHQRRADETPLEYAAELSDHFPEIAGAARQAARFLVRVAYAERGPGDGCRKPLEGVWEKLTATARRPVMAVNS